MEHSIKVIGKKQIARKEVYLITIKEIQGLELILNKDFKIWSEIDFWDDMRVQQWVFANAMYVYKGNKIDIKCDCCDFIYSLHRNFDNIKIQKCSGVKTAYIIKKILGEIIIAKERRDNDGTYTV